MQQKGMATQTKHDSEIRMVVFDWAGTAVDFGCFAPIRPFMEAMARSGVEVTVEQARAPMGLSKRDHLEALFRIPEVTQAWKQKHGRDWTTADVDAAYTKHFMPLQLQCAAESSDPVPGLIETMKELRTRGIKVGTSTGYFKEAAEVAAETARKQGYEPDHNMCGSDVEVGRPAPWMMFRNMEALGVYPPAAVVKVGDTIPDVEEGLNAGSWIVGVTDSSSEIGLTVEEFEALPDSERHERTSAWAAKLREAGAHDVIPTVAELPAALDRIEERIRQGEKP
jgi:phosphonoacetaldehyde hydrolase